MDQLIRWTRTQIDIDQMERASGGWDLYAAIREMGKRELDAGAAAAKEWSNDVASVGAVSVERASCTRRTIVDASALPRPSSRRWEL